MPHRFKTIPIHIACWLLFLLYDWLVRANIIEYPQYAVLEFKGSLARAAMLAATTYFVLFKLYASPFFQRNRFWLFGALVLITILSGLLIRLVLFGLVYPLHYGQEPTMIYAFKTVSKPIASIVNGGFVFCIATMIYFTNQWQKQLQFTKQLEAAHKGAELALLRSQVQPHFIFNTLNNIFTLSLKGSAQTSEMIYRLADLLRYMLYDSGAETVSIEKELSYIENYLSLEKLRYNGTLDVLVNRFGDLSNTLIPPLILLPLVENCIKHGAGQQIGLAWIRIDILKKAESLLIQIENSKADRAKATTTSQGIGIRNVTKRLRLIYADNHQVTITDEGDSFMVILKLPNLLKA
jgi:LytS/YehU family sensor histidine kinase